MVLSPGEPARNYYASVAPWSWKDSPPDFSGWLGRYRSLNNWDSGHYLNIAETGYHLTSLNPESSHIHNYENNVAFFPGFPMLARGLYRFTGISADLCLLLVAQIMAIVALVYWLLLVNWNSEEYLFKNKRYYFYVGSLLIFLMSYPSFFYLVVGYSESTFIAHLMGTIYWSSQMIEKKTKNPMTYGLFLFHALGLGLTRVVALPMVFFPLILSYFDQLKTSNTRSSQRAKTLKDYGGMAMTTLLEAGWMSVLIALGCCFYFGYLQIHFGDYHVYFNVQKTGWSNVFDLLGPFRWDRYLLFLNGPFFSSNQISQAYATLWTLIHLGLFFKFKKMNALQKSLLLCSWGLFLFTFMGRSHYQLWSMIRYTLPMIFLVTIILGQMWLQSIPLVQKSRLMKVVIGILVLSGIQWLLQGWLLVRHLYGQWVS